MGWGGGVDISVCDKVLVMMSKELHSVPKYRILEPT